jgi:hypothetical protein
MLMTYHFDLGCKSTFSHRKVEVDGSIEAICHHQEKQSKEKAEIGAN